MSSRYKGNLHDIAQYPCPGSGHGDACRELRYIFMHCRPNVNLIKSIGCRKCPSNRWVGRNRAVPMEHDLYFARVLVPALRCFLILTLLEGSQQTKLPVKIVNPHDSRRFLARRRRRKVPRRRAAANLQAHLQRSCRPRPVRKGIRRGAPFHAKHEMKPQ